MSNPLKIGFIGVGGIAGQHLRTLKKFRDEKARVPAFELVCGADSSEEAKETAKREYGMGHTYADFGEMLDKHPDLDAVSICTPNHLHEGPAVACLERGMHVMVEKPMARTVAECESMIAAAEKAKKERMVGFQWRWHGESRFIRRQVEDGVLGDVIYTRVQALRRRGIPNWGTFGQKAKNGGGPLIDMGVHLLELAVFLMGSRVPKPKRVAGNIWTYLGNRPDETENLWPKWDHSTYDVEDLAVGHVTFENGSSLVLEASFAAHIEQETNDVNLMGTRGGAHWKNGTVFADQHGYMLNMKPGYIRKTDIWVEKMRHFLEVSAGERENVSSGYEGLAVQKILNGIYDAAEAGREIEL